MAWPVLDSRGGGGLKYFYNDDGQLQRSVESKDFPSYATPEEIYEREDEVQCGVCGRWYPYGTYHECPEVDEE
jgi:hypothetical protein